MLTVHHLGVSQSERIVWLCEELEIPYELVRYERDPVTRAGPAAYRALTPFGTAPVITDGDLVLGESGAIVEYVIAIHGGGRLAVPPGAPNFADYLFWFHFANGSLMPAGMIELVIRMLGVTEAAGTAAILSQRGDRGFAVLEDRLGTVPYLAGEFSAADIMTVFALTTMRLFAPRDITPYPNILAYLQRIGARPAFRRAMVKADPDMPILLT